MTATRKKRILSIQPGAERGGSDYCLLRMVRSLAGDGWECHIALPARSPLEGDFVGAGAVLHVVPMKRITKSGSPLYWAGYLLTWPVSVVRLIRLARKINPGIIHSNSLHSWYGWAVAAIVGRPHVWHGREIVFQSSAALKVERWLCRHFAAKVIAVSVPVGLQLEGADVTVIHDVVDATEFSPGRAGRFRKRVGIADEAPLVGAAGRIDTWKGFDVVLDAVESMQAARPGLEVAIAGGPIQGKQEYAERLSSRAAGMVGVHWLGERDDMADFMADLDAFVLASTEPEPYGMVLTEALASGVPVVATDHGGPPEILADLPEATGRLVPPCDPSALAQAAIAILPPGSSGVERRKGRHAVLLEQTTTFSEVFEGVLSPGEKGGPRG